MIKTSVIHQIPPITTISKVVKSTSAPVENVVYGSEISKAASESVSALQQGLIRAKNNKLNLKGEAAEFFGVDSAENIMVHLDNHLKLIDLKCGENNIIPILPKRTYFSADKPSTLENVWNKLWCGRYGKQFEGLYDKPARMTFYSKCFGKNGEEGTHTIGILYHPKTKTLYCLDSIPNTFKEVKEYQEALKRYVFDSPSGEIKNIIFSNKPQQNFNEYTCNNWTLANIEALQKALKEGKKIDSVEKLNEVLPDNINEILEEQYRAVIKSK